MEFHTRPIESQVALSYIFIKTYVHLLLITPSSTKVNSPAINVTPYEYLSKPPSTGIGPVRLFVHLGDTAHLKIRY